MSNKLMRLGAYVVLGALWNAIIFVVLTRGVPDYAVVGSRPAGPPIEAGERVRLAGESYVVLERQTAKRGTFAYSVRPDA